MQTPEEKLKAHLDYLATPAGRAAYLRAQKKYRLSTKGKEASKRNDHKRRHNRNPEYKKRKQRRKDARTFGESLQYLGIDGEGQGKSNHVYVFLACSNRDGSRSWSVEHESWENSWTGIGYSRNVQNISTEAALQFTLAIPVHNSKTFAYAYNYDLTKQLTDVPNYELYKLFRPELRQRFGNRDVARGPKPIRFLGFFLNLQGSKFTVSRNPRRGAKRQRIVWDIFRFYGSSFVNALKDWRVGHPDLHARMLAMKTKRGEFDREPPESVRQYCLEECACMGELAYRLVEAHNKVDLPLRSFYGAGSSASAMLTKMNIKEQLRDSPVAMSEAIASAFFGGRFENSVIGPIRERVYNYDISSAYPYQLYFLPCHMHGRWRLSKNRGDLEHCRAALVHHSVERVDRTIHSWGPFPYRTQDGSICFPKESAGGWVYREEFLAGEKLFPGVRFREAWVYDCHCDCHPFKQIGYYYLYRIKIGKEGPGIVIKLAVNSCYGKLAQSVGNAVFNNWLWAGMITSGTRAQLLELLALHKDPSNALMMATDGLATRERLVTPVPRDTGTFELLDGGVNPKPLGGWEEKVIDKGMFLARPGIYFPMNPTEAELKDVRGRGVGKGVVYENWKKITASFEKHGIAEPVRVANVARFCGAKTCISKSARNGIPYYRRAEKQEKEAGHELPRYGQWITRPVDMGFDPMPKRNGVNRDGVTLKLRLQTRRESTPYAKAVLSPEARELLAAAQEQLEQPDADFTLWGLE